MAVWYDKLYIGENALPLCKEIRAGVEKGRYIPGIYLITLSSNDKEQLDIFDEIQLYMPALKRRLQPIIAIAAGKEEAMSLFCTIAGDVQRETGGLKIRQYFEKAISLSKEP